MSEKNNFGGMSFLENTDAFITAQRVQELRGPGIYLVGIPFDGTTSFRPGARFGPKALRAASWGLENYSPYLDRDLEDGDGRFFDLGDLAFSPSGVEKIIKNFRELWESELQLGAGSLGGDYKIVTLGGEHSISFAPISLYAKAFPDLCLVHLDAHADLRDGYLDEPFSHASVIRRSVELLDRGGGADLIQYGIRSGTREEFQWMKARGSRANSLEELLERLRALPAGRPVYLTLDLDFFDPAYLPGTGTPESGGENFESFIKIVKVLAQKNLVGADVVELAPMLDPSDVSSCLAAKVVRELVLAMGK